MSEYYHPYLSDAACVARTAAFAARLGAGLRDGSTLDEVAGLDYAGQALAVLTAMSVEYSVVQAHSLPEFTRRVALGPVPTGPRWSREALARMTYDWRRARCATLVPRSRPERHERPVAGVAT